MQHAKLKAGRKLLLSMFDISLIAMSLLKPVYIDREIVDFEILAVNKELEKQTKRNDLVGKMYAQEYPGIKSMGLFDLLVKVIETGIPEQIEYRYVADGFDNWFSSMFIKTSDGIVSSNLDITSKKELESARFKTFTILQQAEDVAQMGSWDYDMISNQLNWSEGMYRLFGLPLGCAVTIGVYLRYATKRGKKSALRIIRAIQSATALFEEELEIKVNKQTKCIKVRATMTLNKDGQSSNFIGVDMDVTNTKAIESDLREVQANFYREIINAQEEERRRIAETLHNELGQLLSVAKLKMDSSQTEATELLNLAIQKVRSISYELTPPLIEDLGLEFALRDMLQKNLIDSGIRCTVIINGLEKRIKPIMEIAIYRILQELLNNVIKHSKANTIWLHVDRYENHISMELRDNGIGISAITNSQPSSFGLNYINNRVKLLQGELSIGSSPSGGSRVLLKLPLNKKI